VNTGKQVQDSAALQRLIRNLKACQKKIIYHCIAKIH